MQAIHTKYIGPTSSRGARIKAYTASRGSFKGFETTISYSHELTGEVCHFEAVKALVEKYKLNWNLESMRYGDSADGLGYCFCFDASIIKPEGQ